MVFKRFYDEIMLSEGVWGETRQKLKCGIGRGEKEMGKWVMSKWQNGVGCVWEEENGVLPSFFKGTQRGNDL